MSKQFLDRHQLKAMLRVSLKLDWRGGTNPFNAIRKSKKKRKIPGMVYLLIVNGFISLYLGLLVVSIPDFFSSLVLASTGVMIFISLQVLLEFSNIIISPTDHAVLAPHPVNSKTFFTAKLTHLLIYVTMLSLTVSVIPTIFAAFRHGIFPEVPVILIQFWTCTVFSALVMMNLYTWIIKIVHKKKLERWIGYFHMIMLLSVYLGMNIIPRMVKKFEAGFDINTIPWIKFLPSFWFAGLYKIIFQNWDWNLFGLGILAVILTLIIAKFAFSYLSLTYAESLSDSRWESTDASSGKKIGILGKYILRVSHFEDKALLKLTRANFKHDVQFRMGILGFLPLIIFYMILSYIIAGTNVKDPFNPLPETQGMTTALFCFVAVIAPGMILSIFTVSKEWRASWIFFSTPLDRLRLILSMGRIAATITIIPVAIIMLILYTIMLGNLLHALLMTIALTLISLTSLSMSQVFSIKPPFASESAVGSEMGKFMQSLLTSLLIFGGPIAWISIKGFEEYWHWGVLVGCFAVINWLISHGRNRRIRKFYTEWEFID
ncbi:MAG: hypothetical protein V3V99_10875 [candidate division Zixibacteria bacterium]